MGGVLEKGGEYLKPERPEGCFAFVVPAPVFQAYELWLFRSRTRQSLEVFPYVVQSLATSATP